MQRGSVSTRPLPGSERRRTRRYALSFSTSFLPHDDSAEAIARLLAATANVTPGGGPAPADSQALETLERVDASTLDSPCAICLDDLRPPEPSSAAASSASSPAYAVRLPRCSHVFHDECLLPWLRDCHGTVRAPTSQPGAR